MYKRAKSVVSLAILMVTLAGCGEAISPSVVSLIRIQNTGHNALSDRGPMSASEFNTYVGTQRTLVKSPFVLNAALREPGISALQILKHSERPLDWLDQNLRISRPGEGEIIQIGLRSKHTEDAKKLVDAVVNAYLSEIIQSETADLGKQLETLRAQYRTNETRIRQKAEIIQRLSEEINSPLAGELTKRKLAMLERELDAVTTELRHLRLEMAVVPPDDSADLTEQMKLLTEEKDQVATRYDQACESFLNIAGFSSDLSARKLEFESLTRANSDLAQRIAQCELELKRPARIQRVQPACVLNY